MEATMTTKVKGKKSKKASKAAPAPKDKSDAFSEYWVGGGSGNILVLEEILGTIEYAVDDIVEDAHCNQDF
eukprot:2072758-Pyramimonas_sp.AAC.1